MSGHSKWSKIKREKQTKDKQKGNVFSKLSRLITLAVIEGGGLTDRENNLKLRLAIEKAKKFNLPKENIERAIEKGTRPESQQLKAVTYEAFGPGGISLIILVTTDNMNRMLSEIKNVLESHGGKLGAQGSVMYLFKKSGLSTFEVLPYASVEISDKNVAEKVLGLIDALEKLDDVQKVFSNFKIPSHSELEAE